MMNAVNNVRSRMDLNKKKSTSLLHLESTGTESASSSNANGNSKPPVQVEPKTYFANERTFIQWISAALLLLTVSSIMMTGNRAEDGSGGYNGTSSVIAFSSLILVAYASYVYFRRVKLLRSGNAYGYLDFVGPTILAAGVGLGVFIVFADAVKGSEFLPWGDGKSDKDDRRFLVSTVLPDVPQMSTPEMYPTTTTVVTHLEEVQGTCSRYAMDQESSGINLLEYQPVDIILHNTTTTTGTSGSSSNGLELIVATPQTLVSHPILLSGPSSVLSELPDTDILSITQVGDRLFALAVVVVDSKTTTQLIDTDNIESRFVIQDSSSTMGSMVFVPSSSTNGNNEDEGKLFIYLDGTLHTYHHVPAQKKKLAALSRVGSINMKVLNRGLNDQPITAMEHFEGLTYMLRENSNNIQAWDLTTATLVAEMSLPSVAKNDQWVGMAFERRNNIEGEEKGKTSLRKGSKMTDDEKKVISSVYLHMPLDTFPPQLWSFRLVTEKQNDGEENEDAHGIFSFPECDGVTLN